MLQQAPQNSIRNKGRQRTYGRSAQIQIEFNHQEENEIVFQGKPYPKVIRISDYCTEILTETKPIRPEVPFKIIPRQTSSTGPSDVAGLKSIFG